MPLSDNAKGALFMSVAMAAFTVNDACMKAVTQALPLYQAILLRGLLCTLALILIAARMGGLRISVEPGDRKWLILRTVGEVGGTLTFLTALRHMPLANLSAVTLAAAVFLHEPIGWRRLLAIAVGLAGVLLIVRPGAEGFDRWAVVGLASVGCVVLRDLATRRMSSAMPSVTVAVAASLSVTVTAAVLVPTEGWGAVAPRAAFLLGLAAACLIAGYLMIVEAMRVGDIGHVAPFRYVALVVAIGLGWAAFGQLPDGLTLLGAAIVVLTGIYSFHRERRLGRAVAVAGPPPPR
jgi:drug/metabolite transporter (DMT)-like permease